MALHSIHLWVPGISETGGIQHYSWCLAKALRELFPAARLVIFSRNDAPGFDPGIEGAEVRCFGAWKGAVGHLLFTVAGWLALLLQRPSLCIATHPAFARALRWMTWTGVPCLAAAHGIEVWGDALQQLKSSLARMTGLLPVSEFTRSVLVNEGGMNADRIAVVPDTFRENAFQTGTKAEYLQTRHGLEPGQPVLLTVGRLAASEAYKGQDRVIAALPAIRRVLPALRYVIAGTGNDENRLRTEAARHGQQDAVIFAGFVPESELADYYRLCDLFAMPSTGEGFGIVYLEALASGRPCLVGSLDASPEAIDHGRLGLVVNPYSVDEIASAVIRFFARDHNQPWLHEPEILHQEAIRLYGFAAFKQSLLRALNRLVPDAVAR